MKKLGIVCALMLACGAASAAAVVGDSSVTLQINNVTVPPMGTQPIPLSQLFPSKPYMVACVIQDPNYAANQAVIGPSFTGAPVVVTYALNGKAFSNSAQLSASSENNTFLATGVENVSAGSGPGASSTLNIGNEDQSDKIVIVSCVATPVLSTK